MKKIDLIINAKHIYTMEGDGVGYKNNFAIAIDKGKIIDLREKSEIDKIYEAEENIVLNDKAIFPGFIDAHMHTSCCIIRGLAQDTNNWMMYGFGPFMNKVTEEQGNLGSELAIIEAVKAGTTTIGDYNKNMDSVCEFIRKVGVRGCITTMVREAKNKTYHPGDLYEFDENLGEKLLLDNLKLYDKWNNIDNGMIKVLFGPQGADFLSKKLLLKIQKIAKERNTKIHMHLQQGDRETYQIEKRYNKRPIAWLDEIGYLDETLIGVHLTDATDEEASLVARRGASMILCPGSIGIIDGIVPPSKAFQDAGGNVALGSDQAPGNNCHNIINEMKNAALFNKIKYQNPEVMPAWKVLRMATIEGARTLGMGDEIGSLEIGKKADLIAIDLKQPTMMPVYTNPMRNIVPNLVYSARGDEVSLVVVDGKIVCKDGKVINIDENEILDKVEKCPDEIGNRASDEFWNIDGTNAIFMKEDKL